MKFVAFFALFFLSVPVMTLAATTSARARGWLVTALLFSTALGDIANINFVSWELYRGPDRGFELNLADLITWSLLPTLLFLSSRRPRLLPYNWGFMAAFFALALLTSVGVDRPLFTAFTLFKLVKHYLVYWVVINCLAQDVPLQAIWRGLIAIGILVTALALKQKYGDGIFRVRGPFDHSNGIPLYLHVAMPVLLLWGLAAKNPLGRRALLSITVALGMVFVVVATQSRAGQVLVLGNLVVALVLANRRYRTGGVRKASLAIVLLALLGGLKSTDSILERFRTAPEQSRIAREELNRTAELMIADHPLMGVGLNQFSHVAATTPRYYMHKEVLANERQSSVAHHIYLLTAAEMGYPGLIVFLIIMGRFMWPCLRHGFCRDSRMSLPLFGCFLGFTAVHLQGFLEWGLRISPVIYLFIMMSAFSVVLTERVRADARSARLRAYIAQASGDGDRGE